MKDFNFQDHTDAAMFAIEEGLLDFASASKLSKVEIEDMCEAMIIDRVAVRKARRRRKGLIRDFAKSRKMKQSWRKKRRKFLSGMKKFNRSMKGKKLHREVARMKKQGRYKTIAEAFTAFSSTLTHLSLNSQYDSSTSAEVDAENLLYEGSRIISPILEALSANPDAENFLLSDIVEAQIAEDAEQFLHDLVLGADIDEDEDCSESAGMYSQKAVVGQDITGDYDEDPDTLEERREKSKALCEKLKGNNDNQLDGKEVKDADKSENPSDGDSVDEDLTPVSMSDLIDISESMEGDTYLSSDQFEVIDESMGDPDVDGKYVIAKVRGPAFFPGRVSGNNVEYTNQLWETALNRPEFKRELEARRIYGTIGHDQVINDKALREGMIGHIVSNMWIDPRTNIGMAEYLLLNEKPGRTTLTLLGAKSKFRVSTRCRGKFLSRNNSRGHKEPDPKLFFIKGVDFVHDPGFEDTEANLVSTNLH